MEHLFGPVPSRRLGFSLGIDIIPAKTCTLNCVYCQLGPTPQITLERKPHVAAEVIISELSRFLEERRRIDYLTLSGSGEPTLNSEIGRIIRGVKEITSIPVAVITNGSLLYLSEVRKDLAEADVVLPSLDASSEETFRLINRPHPKLSAALIIQGLKIFSREYTGKIWLEIMLVRGINDSPEELAKLREVIGTLHADKVQLNTVVRPPAEPNVLPLSQEEMERAAKLIGHNCEIIADFAGQAPENFQADEGLIISTLKRRPLTLNDLTSITGLNPNELTKILERLVDEGKIREQDLYHRKYYAA